MIRALLILFCTLPVFASQEEVTVRWKVQFTLPNGTVSLRTLIDSAYTRTLKNCGHTIEALELDHLPVNILRCPGVLDFSQSNVLRGRLQKRLQAYADNGHPTIQGIEISALIAAAAKIDFAISRHGIFEGNEKLLSPRRVAINVAQANLVILNDHYWEQISAGPDIDALLLHELLGALGFDDGDYQISLAILTDLPGNFSIAMEKDSGGGISVVGHGGNPTEFFVKASLLRFAKAQALHYSDEDPRFVPTVEELTNVILRTPITLVTTQFMMQYKVCRPGEKTQSKYRCGYFLPKLSTLDFTAMLTEDLGLIPQKKREELIYAMYGDLVMGIYDYKEKHFHAQDPEKK